MINEVAFDKRENTSASMTSFCLATLKTFENNLTLEALSQEETLWKFVTTFGTFWSSMIPFLCSYVRQSMDIDGSYM